MLNALNDCLCVCPHPLTQPVSQSDCGNRGRCTLPPTAAAPRGAAHIYISYAVLPCRALKICQNWKVPMILFSKHKVPFETQKSRLNRHICHEFLEHDQGVEPRWWHGLKQPGCFRPIGHGRPPYPTLLLVSTAARIYSKYARLARSLRTGGFFLWIDKYKNAMFLCIGKMGYLVFGEFHGDIDQKMNPTK